MSDEPEFWAKRARGAQKESVSIESLVKDSKLSEFIVGDFEHRVQDRPVYAAATAFAGTIAMKKLGVDPILFGSNEIALAAALKTHKPGLDDGKYLEAAADFSRAAHEALGIEKEGPAR